MATSKMKKPKFKIGQFVYSYQNPNERRPINYIKESSEQPYAHRYRLTLTDASGYGKNSNWIDEQSLSLKKQK
jgi:hypothetical protein